MQIRNLRKPLTPKPMYCLNELQLKRVNAIVAASHATAEKVFTGTHLTKHEPTIRKEILHTAKTTRVVNIAHLADTTENLTRISYDLAEKIKRLDQRHHIYATGLHEITHRFKYSANHFVTAKAISSYVRMLYSKRLRPKGKKIISLKEAEQIEWAYSQEVCDKIKGKTTARTEYRKNLNGKMPSFYEIGNNLGLLAARTETQLNKPGTGIFIIKEISKGTPPSKAILMAKKGLFAEQIKDLFANDPQFKRLLLNATKNQT